MLGVAEWRHNGEVVMLPFPTVYERAVPALMCSPISMLGVTKWRHSSEINFHRIEKQIIL